MNEKCLTSSTLDVIFLPRFRPLFRHVVQAMCAKITMKVSIVISSHDVR